MLVEKLRDEREFTKHERDVARYILEHMDDIPGMSAGEVARESLTSKATVVRLSQKLGLAGYQELRVKLAFEASQKERIGRLLADEPINANSSCDDIVRTLPMLYDKALTNTRLAFDKNSLRRISRQLQTAECIDIYGTGISYILAQSAAFKFGTLGVESSAYESINAYYLAARRNKRTVSFLISFTGANRTVCGMAQYLREATNNYVVGILGPHNEAIRPWCHEVVEVANRDSLLSLDVITSFTGVTYVTDIFFSMLLAGRYEEHAKSSLEMLEHTHLLWDDAYKKADSKE